MNVHLDRELSSDIYNALLS